MHKGSVTVSCPAAQRQQVLVPKGSISVCGFVSVCALSDLLAQLERGKEPWLPVLAFCECPPHSSSGNPPLLHGTLCTPCQHPWGCAPRLQHHPPKAVLWLQHHPPGAVPQLWGVLGCSALLLLQWLQVKWQQHPSARADCRSPGCPRLEQAATLLTSHPTVMIQ